MGVIDCNSKIHSHIPSTFKKKINKSYYRNCVFLSYFVSIGRKILIFTLF